MYKEAKRGLGRVMSPLLPFPLLWKPYHTNSSQFSPKLLLAILLCFFSFYFHWAAIWVECDGQLPLISHTSRWNNFLVAHLAASSHCASFFTGFIPKRQLLHEPILWASRHYFCCLLSSGLSFSGLSIPLISLFCIFRIPSPECFQVNVSMVEIY